MFTSSGYTPDRCVLLKTSMSKSLSIISLLIILLASCSQKAKDEQVVEWITDNAIEIYTVEAGSGFEDLVPIGEMVGDARIVSLGEPTHGNREVFQLKHRLIEYLVNEKGFNIFALECPFGEAFDVNQYILDGIGTPEEALAGINYWAWDTKELVALLKWLRAYNADPSHNTKVKFYGFDMQDPERAARFMLNYLQKVDPQLKQEVHSELNILQVPFSEPKLMGRRPYVPEEYDEAGLTAIRKVIESFSKKREDYISISSNKEYILAKQHTRLVEMWIEACINDGQNYVDVRENGQAENINWILNYEDSNSKAIVWAHNSHVANQAPSMGKHLKGMFGDQLKIFGLFFNRGEFWALDIDVPSKGMENFLLEPAPKGTLEHAIASAGVSLAVLDMEKLPVKGSVHDWFNTSLKTRHSGSGYNLKTPENYFWDYVPAKEFDALIYLDNTTPVQVINRLDFDEIWMLDKKLEKYRNLDFESNEPGEVPQDWLTWSKFQRIGVRFEVTNENPYQGENAVLLHRSQRIAFGEHTPNLTQTIDASLYREKKIRIKAAVRSDIQSSGFAFFRMVIEPDVLQSAHDGSPPLFDSLDKFRIESSQWNILEIEAEVPKNANTINYGIYLRDFGTVWLDAVSIELIE